MSNLDYTYKLNKDISVWIYGDIFEYSFKNKTKTLDMLDLVDLALQKIHKIIWINWSEWSSKIKTINSKDISEQAKLLEWWIDWLIIRDLNKFNKKISIVLWVADCWAISFTNEKWDIIWLIHAWYNWAAWDIIWNIFKELTDIKDFSKYKFYIWPMMWENFELDEKFYKQLFKDLFCKYNFNYNNYIYKKYIKDWENKIHLNLRKIILDVFIKNWIYKNQIEFSEIVTNSKENKWPSFRENRTNKRIWVFLEN